ncbi:MAG: hypothetical protein JSR76_05885 [Verrucomicrobia bacterium]|nr:hypothetical protein [Verrucomicrobiota bacterium]
MATIAPLSSRMSLPRETLSFPGRFFGAFRTILEISPRRAASSAMASLAVVVSLLATDSFLVQGAYYSLQEIRNCTDPDRVTCLAPMGNIGGWLTEVLVDLLMISAIGYCIVREGEYLKLRQEVRASFSPDKQTLLEAANAHRLFPDNHTTISIEKASPSVRPHLEGISLDLSQASSLACLKRAPKTPASVIFGGIFPLLFTCTAISAAVGEVGLAKLILIKREELAETGHLGEWPLNILAAQTFSIFAVRALLNEGFLEIAYDAYARCLDLLKNEEALYNELREIGNQELAMIASTCRFLTPRLLPPFSRPIAEV